MRFALIGCGGHGKRVAKWIHAARNAELTHLVDPDIDAMHEIGEAGENLTGCENMPYLHKHNYDAVWITAPNYLHAEYVLKAARAGKHIVCEKPMSPHLLDCKKMMNAAENAGVALTVPFTFRYNPEVVQARDVIHSGRIGQVASVLSWSMLDKPADYWHGSWRGAIEKSGGGVLLMNAIHMIDLVPWLTGLVPVKCSAAVVSFVAPPPVEDTASVLYTLSNSAPWSMQTCGVSHNCRSSYGVLVQGTKGIAEISETGLFWAAGGDEHEIEKGTGPPLGDPHVLFLEDFVAAVEADKAPPIPPGDGFRAAALVHAAYDSAAQNCVVKVEVGP